MYFPKNANTEMITKSLQKTGDIRTFDFTLDKYILRGIILIHTMHSYPKHSCFLIGDREYNAI